MSIERPAGMPSRMTTSARPCDSPAVRKRTIQAPIVYEVSAPLAPAFRGLLRKTAGLDMGESLAARPRMPQILADRFMTSGSAWIDLATGGSVRLRIVPAGSSAEQKEWSARCAVLANLRH